VAKLNIFVNEKNGQTVSKFGKAKDSEKIVFHNQHPTQTLTVTVVGETPAAGVPLCEGPGQNTVSSFTVAAAGQQAYKICNAYLADTFKYTATIQGATPEDPIIIIERKRLLDNPIVLVAAGAAAGVVAGVVICTALANGS